MVAFLVYDESCSENGQFCAIKEVQVISDDPHSKERLKQLNQVISQFNQYEYLLMSSNSICVSCSMDSLSY